MDRPMPKHSLQNPAAGFLGLLLGILLSGGIQGCSTASRHLESPESLRNLYVAAIRDAAVAEPWEIERKLTAITPYEPGLVWQGRPGESPLRVVTWTRNPVYEGKAGEEMTREKGAWVTIVPEILEFCRSRGPRRSELRPLRLEQLLGLPPAIGKKHFVEMWVTPQDLFRPCPDPEISDHECGLVSPISGAFVKIEDEYVTWFEELRKTGYSDDGYPWTRLGYTYDWGNPKTEIGLSEFVIRQGSTVTIHSVTPTEEYCVR